MKKERFACKRDDLTIRGHIFGDIENSRSAVILCHGFLANEHMCFDYARALAEKGIPAVTFDFCGGGVICHSDGKSRDMTVITEKADLLAVILAVKKQYKVRNIVLMGCSQGGFVSGLAAAELKELVRGLVMFYPAVCIPDDARSGKMMFYTFDPQNIPDLLGSRPMKLGGMYAKSVIDMDPYAEMQGYDGPVLLVHGTEDQIVNIRYARKLRDVYAHCDYLEIEGAGHGFKGKDDQTAVSELLGFVKEIL